MFKIFTRYKSILLNLSIIFIFTLKIRILDSVVILSLFADGILLYLTINYSVIKRDIYENLILAIYLLYDIYNDLQIGISCLLILIISHLIKFKMKKNKSYNNQKVKILIPYGTAYYFIQYICFYAIGDDMIFTFQNTILRILIYYLLIFSILSYFKNTK